MRLSWYSVVIIEYPLSNNYCIGTKLSDDSRKYGAENTCTSGSTLSKAALSFSRARAQLEKEHGNLLKALGTQVELACLPSVSCQVLQLSFINQIMITNLFLVSIICFFFKSF